jgi:lipoprotein-anchoring transpeptidase ErfK/SrfK
VKVEGIKLRIPALAPAWSELRQALAKDWRARLFPAVLGAWLVLASLMVVSGRVYFYRSLTPLPDRATPAVEPARLGPEARRQLAQLETEARRARAKLAGLKPRGIYIVIDAASNTLYLKRGGEVLHRATCSTGSGLLLRDPAGNRQWVFDTPRGLFQVLEKVEDPVWKKPDWAFIEEGLPVPKRFSERLDDDSLGEYALYFGNGYMIHGTLYQRYLGRSITHGCVRLGDADLKKVFHLAPLGTPIYIF